MQVNVNANVNHVFLTNGCAVDCIDCAAVAAVVSVVNDGIKSARDIVGLRRPWSLIWRIVHLTVQGHARLFVLLSLNEGNCTLKVLNGTDASRFLKGGVISTERCYGSGHCFPVCPYSNIRVVTYIRDTTATADLIKRNGIDAVEIHTSGRQTALFERLWDGLGDSIAHLRLICVSLANVGDSTLSSMNTMYSIVEPNLPCFNLWQLDGHPMSGDIGLGATRESTAFAVRLAAL
ncbi:hypothetical protein SO802_026714 [Lithocarpus litseifolius]|uniref:4Fe-4S ferredoxin-type domain-containing protein n=1 Tax=Lithocarpus litseifolius TaxID=425828 RepID=A0AAW2C424_9ROSI